MWSKTICILFLSVNVTSAVLGTTLQWHTKVVGTHKMVGTVNRTANTLTFMSTGSEQHILDSRSIDVENTPDSINAYKTKSKSSFKIELSQNKNGVMVNSSVDMEKINKLIGIGKLEMPTLRNSTGELAYFAKGNWNDLMNGKKVILKIANKKVDPVMENYVKYEFEISETVLKGTKDLMHFQVITESNITIKSEDDNDRDDILEIFFNYDIDED